MTTAAQPARRCSLQARHQLDQVARPVPVVELVADDVVPAVAAGAGRAGQGEKVCAARDPGGGAALDRRGADLLVAEPAEQFAEPGDLLLVHVVEGFRRHVAPGDAGAAGGDHGIDRGIGDPLPELRHDRGAVVLDDAAPRHAVAGGGDQLGERVAGFVVGLGPRVGHGEDGDVDGKERAALINSRHSGDPARLCRARYRSATRPRQARRDRASPGPGARDRSSSWSARAW